MTQFRCSSESIRPTSGAAIPRRDADSRATIAVVGAGVSGLIAARELARAGLEVVVFDKGRRPGGRVNTREHGSYRFDHGASCFTATHPRVRALLRDWLAAGVVARWHGRVVVVRGGWSVPEAPKPRFVGVPGMIALAQYLGAGLDIRSGVRISEIRSTGSAHELTDAEGVLHGRFERVIVALPAPQATPLLGAAPALAKRSAAAVTVPTWAAMLAFESRLDLSFDAAFMHHGVLSWCSRDNSKPGRPSQETWVLHATPEWTRAHWHLDRDTVADEMFEALNDRFGPLPVASFKRAHRWGYARAEPASEGPLYDAEAGMGVCGDWCRSGGVEGAIVSGLGVAQAVLQEMGLGSAA